MAELEQICEMAGEMFVVGREERTIIKRRDYEAVNGKPYESLKPRQTRGTRYSIKGIYNLLRPTSPEKLIDSKVIETDFIVHEQVEVDLRNYESEMKKTGNKAVKLDGPFEENAMIHGILGTSKFFRTRVYRKV